MVNLNFWDGLLISSMFWFIVSVISLIRGLWVGSQSDYPNWAEGYTDGWNAACERYNLEIYETNGGNMNI